MTFFAKSTVLFMISWLLGAAPGATGVVLAGDTAILAFPGAQGFGATSIGGRGGMVVRVTSLADAGRGSLRWALEGLEFPRIVVFDVAGTIALQREIKVNGRVTIAGQTAPGPGITITGARLQIVGDDVIIRGLHIRPGRGEGQDLGARDGVSIGAKNTTVSRVILDRTSISWATDENVALWYDVRDVTVSNCIVAEALNQAGHPQGRHSMGMLIGPGASRVSVLGNLFFANYWRNPQIASAGPVEVINNVVANYGPGGLTALAEQSRIDVIHNVFLAGQDTPDRDKRPAIRLKSADRRSQFFVKGNVTPLGPDAVEINGAPRLRDGSVIGARPVPLRFISKGVLEQALTQAGARVPITDGTDHRILTLVRQGKGQVVDVPPEPMAARMRVRSWRGPDRDADFIPDHIEMRLGSDPDLADAHQIAPSGYAYIEILANALISGEI